MFAGRVTERLNWLTHMNLSKLGQALSAREIFDRLLIGEHTVTLKQIVHHTRCRGRRWRCSLAICEMITLLMFA